MSSCNKFLLVAFLVAVISACQSGPEIEPQVSTEQVAQASEPVEVFDVDQQNYEAGLDAIKAGETGFAIALLEQVSISAPEKEHVFTNLGLAYFKQEDYDKAERAFQQAIRLNPDDAIAYNHLGILKRLRGEFDSARLTYQKAIQIDNEYAGAYLNLGILYDIYLQDLELALQQYEKYRALTRGENHSVDEWIVDIQRQLKTARAGTQG
jgi:tetratricopeptide (TPR) repeat protein